MTPTTSLSPHSSWSSVVETTATPTSAADDRLEQQADDLAAVVDLLERVAAATDLTASCHTVVLELQQYVSCERVVLGFCGPGAACRLHSVSGAAEFDPAAPLARAIENAFDETLANGASITWLATAPPEPDSLFAHRKLAEITSATVLFSVPLALDDSPIGVCIFFGAGGRPITDRQQRFARTCAGPLAAVLAAHRRSELLPWLRTLNRIIAEKIAKRRKLLVPVLAICLAAMFLPIRYRVSTDCQLQPVTRRVISAPFEGTLERSFVKPGDVVHRGDTLGHIDGREIRWELAGLLADERRAAKNRDVNMADNKIAVAQMDALEMRRIEVKRRLLADRAEHLDIKSPIDGMVISGDLKRAEGAPVAVGQTLYEIAPLDRMVAEIAIPDDEIARVRSSQPVIIRLDAFSGCEWTGDIATIEPRSESRDSENVFIGEVQLDNHDLNLRPGMKGRAKIETDSHALGWIMFHRAWNRVAGWLGW